LREELVDVRAADADTTADANRGQLFLVDPVPEGLRVEPQALGDLIDGEKLSS
jgi:hypothetical protein